MDTRSSMNYKSLAAYVMDQLSDLDGVRHIPMMGGYVFYIHDRVFGGIYESGMMVKCTPSSRRYMPDAEPMPPYEGAKDMLPVTILDDREAFRQMVAAMADELPPPKQRKKKRAI